MASSLNELSGAGLGLRRALIDDLQNVSNDDLDFMEIAPENWIGEGGIRFCL